MKLKETAEDFKMKIRSAKYVIQTKVQDAVEWIKDHPTESVMLATAGTAALSEVRKCVNRAHQMSDMRKEQELRDRYIYDRSSGMYLKTRKNLTQAERTEYSIRRSRGESAVDILRSLRLL